MSKRTNAPVYTFKLKNNIIVRVFINAIKKKLNSQRYYLVLRGRHSDRKKLYTKLNMEYKPGTQNDVPLDHAETFGIYIKEKLKYNGNAQNG